MKHMAHFYSWLLNISREGLKFYESKGFLNPGRDLSNGYRTYGWDDIHAVMICKKYRRYGFSLKEIFSLMHHASPDDILRRLNLRAEALEKEILEQKKILASLNAKIRQMEEVRQDWGKFTIVERPALYWLPIGINQVIVDDPRHIAAIRRWNELFPHPDGIIIWSLEKLLGGEGEVSFGYMLEADDAKAFSPGEVRYLPPSRCLYSATDAPDYCTMQDTPFGDMLRYMRKKHLTPAGDGTARIVRGYVDAENKRHEVLQLWLPVESRPRG
jgi:DNA-binding transcriptional MerR regulator